MATRNNSADWRRIEFEYLSGEDSISEIADRHSISRAAIQKRAKKDGWKRAVAPPKKVQPERQPPPPPPTDPLAPLDNAAIADQGRALVARMFDELRATTSEFGALEDMIIAATEDDDEDGRRDAMMRAVTLPTRANTLKALSAAFKTLNEASAPQGKKAAQQDKAQQVANRFAGVGPPTLKAVK